MPPLRSAKSARFHGVIRGRTRNPSRRSTSLRPTSITGEMMEPQTQTAPVAGKKVAPKKKVKKAASRAISTVVRQPTLPAPSSLLQVIAQATLDPRCDVAKMQALLDMQER